MKAQEMFEKDSVWKTIAKMAVPAVITMVVMILYNLADTYFVAKTGSHDQMAAVSLASPVFMLQMAIGTLVGGGGCAAVSKLLGEKKVEKVRSLSAAAMLICVGLGSVFGVLLFVGTISTGSKIAFLLQVLGADQATAGYTAAYIRILAVGMPVVLFANAFANLIRGEGAAKESMIANFGGTVTNIILDPIFISVLGLGVQGAALATVLGNLVTSALLLLYIYKKNSVLRLNPLYCKGAGWAFASIFTLGIPSALGNLLVGFANTVSNRFLIAYGAKEVAAQGVGSKAAMVGSMVVMGICLGVQPYIAYCYGAGNREKVQEIIKKNGLLVIVLGGLITAGCFLFRRELAGFFLPAGAVQEEAVHIMEITLLSGPVIGLFYLGTNYMQAIGKALPATVLSLVRQGLLLIPATILFHAAFGKEGVFYAVVVTDFLSAAVSVFLIQRYSSPAKAVKEYKLEGVGRM